MSRIVRGSDLVDSTPNVTGEIWPTVDDLADYIVSHGNVALDIPGTVPRPVNGALSDAISVKWFGAKGDGVTNDTAAFNAALSLGRPVLVPESSGAYVITSQLVFTSGSTLYGIRGLPELRWNNVSSSLMLSFDGTSRAGIAGLRINGVKASTPAGEVVSMGSANRCFITECEFIDCQGTNAGFILVDGASVGNEIANNTLTNCNGTGIGLSGLGVKRNRVHGNDFTGQAAFGIRLGEGASKNEITSNTTEQNGIELIGLTSDCFENRIIGNHAEGCGDNGISVSGDRNTVIGNECIRNAKAGIWFWGSFNTCTGNICLSNNLENLGNNWAGIGVSANFGGTGQHNTIVDNLCDDDQVVPTQFNGVRLAGTAYANWAAGAPVASGTYRVNGLNVYQATTTGTTGASPPIHTSGDVSDGGVTWRYKRTFLTSANSWFNTVADNNSPRFSAGGAAYFDQNNWANNTLVDRQQINQTVTGNVNLSVGAGMAYFWNIGGAGELRLNSTELRPEVDSGLSLGLTNRRWTAVYSAGFHSGASGATQQVVGSRRTGWTQATGTADRTAFDTGTVTTTQLAQRVKALLDDLFAHGLIGN